MPLPPVSSLGRENEKGNMPGQEYNIGKGHWKMENEKGNVPGQEQDSPLKKRPLPHYHRWERRTTKEKGQGSWLKRIEITTLPVSLLKRKEKYISKKEVASKCNIATCSLLPPPSYCRGGERQEPQRRRASQFRDQALLSSEASLGCYFSVFTFNNPKTKHRFHF